MSLCTDPRLLPGLPVLRRDARNLQVGLDERGVVLPDVPEVRTLLQQLSGQAPGPLEAHGRATVSLSRLADAGLLVDRSALDTLTSYAAAPVERAAAAATLHCAPDDAEVRWRNRAEATLRIDATGATGADRTTLERILAVGGVVPRAGTPDLTLLLLDREPARDQLDALVQADLPHLLVRADFDHVVLGPFVAPGRTACVRCLDAHLADGDPRRPLLLEQQAHADLPTVRDPALWHLALGWAARDVLRWLDGEEPSTWSATVRIGPDLRPQHRSWGRHPHCGCGWAELHRTGSRDGSAHQNSESSLPSMERRCTREQLSQ